MKRITQFLVVAGVTLVFSSLATAQEFKIGFVNTDRIFREANSALTAQTKLQQEFSKREKDLTGQGDIQLNPTPIEERN